MFTLFLTDLDFDQYNKALMIILYRSVEHNGYTSEMTSYNIEVEIDCYDELMRCCEELTNSNIEYTI